jgi:hypothetical protein
MKLADDQRLAGAPHPTLRVSGVRYARPVGKRLTLKGGQLVKTMLTRGPDATAINLEFGTFADYCVWRDTLDGHNMLVAGTFEPGLPDGTPVAYKDTPAEFDGAVVASNDYLAFRAGGAVARIDFDVKRPDEVAALYPPERTIDSPEALHAALVAGAPYLVGVAMRISDSSGSMIYDMEGRQLKGAGGLRAELPISDGTAIPALLEDLHQRSWAHGYGWAFVSRGGALLERGLADLALARPHQPDFVTPTLGRGLERRPRVLNVPGSVLTFAPGEVTGAAEKLQAMRDTLRPTAAGVQRDVTNARVAEAVARGVAPDVAQAAVEAAFQGRRLLPSVEITFADGARVTVATLLERGAAYDGRRCHDPVEPDYRGGEDCALFLWRGGAPKVLSYAHQQTWYELVRETEPALLEEIPGPGPFPVDDLPAPVAAMVREVARFVQVDPAMVAGQAIGLLAACVMRQCRVREKPGLESYLTQFIITAAESGERKSAVHGHLVRPVDLTEREWAQEDQKALAAHEAKIAESREAANVKKRTAALKSTAPEDKKALLKEYGDLIRKAKELERGPPTVRQVYLDDTTEAAFASNLKRAGGALSLVSPEGRGFVATLLGYYANKQAKDAVYLQAYSGDTIKVARKTGGADGGELLTTIYEPASSFALMVQGDVVEELNRHIMLERSGFSNRVTYVRTTPMAGRRFELEDEQPFDEGVRKAWDALVTNLLKHKDEDAPPIMLVLDDDAQAHRRTFHNALEARLAGDLVDHAGLVSKWTTKTSKLAALIALIEACAQAPLHHLLEGANKAPRLDVTGEHWLAAQPVAEWLLRSTIGVRQLSGELPEERDAKLVLEYLQRRRGQWTYPRELVQQLHRKGLQKIEQALAALGALHAAGVIERQDGRNVGSHRFRVP